MSKTKSDFKLGIEFEAEHPPGSQPVQVPLHTIRGWQLAVDPNDDRVRTKDGLVRFLKTSRTVFANFPLPCTLTGFQTPKKCYYFEVTIQRKEPVSTISVGLCTRPFPEFRIPGWNKYSVGFHSTGHRFLHDGSRPGQPYGSAYKAGDVVGCAFDTRQAKVFYTLNGKVLDVIDPQFPAGMQLWPSIGSHGEALISVNFGATPFKWETANKQALGFDLMGPKPRHPPTNPPMVQHPPNGLAGPMPPTQGHQGMATSGSAVAPHARAAVYPHRSYSDHVPYHGTCPRQPPGSAGLAGAPGPPLAPPSPGEPYRRRLSRSASAGPSAGPPRHGAPRHPPGQPGVAPHRAMKPGWMVDTQMPCHVPSGVADPDSHSKQGPLYPVLGPNSTTSYKGVFALPPPDGACLVTPTGEANMQHRPPPPSAHTRGPWTTTTSPQQHHYSSFSQSRDTRYPPPPPGYANGTEPRGLPGPHSLDMNRPNTAVPEPSYPPQHQFKSPLYQPGPYRTQSTDNFEALPSPVMPCSPHAPRPPASGGRVRR